MVLTPRLDQRQSQSLVMTPQLQQAIKLLQLSNIELQQYVEKELETNPMLEREEVESQDNLSESESSSLDDLENNEYSLPDINFDLPESAVIPKSRELDADGDNTYTNDSNNDISASTSDFSHFETFPQSRNQVSDDYSNNIEQTLTQNISLRDYLIKQTFIDFIDPSERLIASYLIDLIDDTGYFTERLDEISQTLGCDLSLVTSVLKKLKEFDPPGIFAQDLRECLSLQLKDKNRLDPYMNLLLENLGLIAEKRFSDLALICKVDAEELDEMLSELRALNPKPGTIFENYLSQPIVPDVLVRPRPNGEWLIELNSETLPRILVNNNYHSQIISRAKNKEEKLYISQQFQSANWLVQSLHKRATTTLKVVTELVKQQTDFFLKGVQFLKPLDLSDIAQSIEMHESTVSRVTTNKFVATPRGIYELKYFFSSAISSTDGISTFSGETIRHMVKTLIDQEAPSKILSDDKIVGKLKGKGVDIARRTVAKYRESMNIPSSVQRRQLKRPPS